MYVQLLTLVSSMFQTAAWLTETTSLSEELERSLSEPVALTTLLLHHAQLGNLGASELHLGKSYRATSQRIKTKCVYQIGC